MATQAEYWYVAQLKPEKYGPNWGLKGVGAVERALGMAALDGVG